MEGVALDEKPGKEDMDALEVHSEAKGGDEEVVPATEQQRDPGPAPEMALKTTPGRSPLSGAEVQALLGDLYSKANFERGDGACVIWNASGTLSLRTGQHMKIDGKDYVTQGVIQDKHLVMGCSREKE